MKSIIEFPRVKSNLLIMALGLCVIVQSCKAMECSQKKLLKKVKRLDLGVKKTYSCTCGSSSKNLSQSIAKNCPACCVICIKQGEDIHGIDDRADLNFLHSAINLVRKDIVFILLEHGANPNKGDYVGRAPLFYADDEEIVEALLDYGADGNQVDESGCPPLINAVERGNSKIIEALLVHGVDLLATDLKGRNALHCAISQADQKNFTLLLNWPLVLAESQELSAQIKLLCRTNKQLNRSVEYILLLLRKMSQHINIKIPKWMCMKIVEFCITDYAHKLWQSPYAQDIFTSNDPKKTALMWVKKLVSQKDSTNVMPFGFVQVKLMLNQKNLEIFIVPEDDEESQELQRTMQENQKNWKAIREMLKSYMKKDQK